MLLETDKAMTDELLEMMHTYKEDVLKDMEGKTFDKGYALGIQVASAAILRNMIDALVEKKDGNWAFIEGVKLAKAVHEVGHIINEDLKECEDLKGIMDDFEKFLLTNTKYGTIEGIQ